jgi:hypothetical protein
LVAALCASQVGAVLCLDASRLARNGRDWHHLLELCGLVDARVIDLDGVYDPCRPNDRLLLGMKGSISEFEHRRLQEVIRLVFQKFRALGSARQVLLWMASQNIHFPYPSNGRTLTTFEWRPIRYRNVISILKNPFYAGVYAYRKSEKRTSIVDGRARKSYGHHKPTRRAGAAAGPVRCIVGRTSLCRDPDNRLNAAQLEKARFGVTIGPAKSGGRRAAGGVTPVQAKLNGFHTGPRTGPNQHASFSFSVALI